MTGRLVTAKSTGYRSSGDAHFYQAPGTNIPGVPAQPQVPDIMPPRYRPGRVPIGPDASPPKPPEKSAARRAAERELARRIARALVPRLVPLVGLVAASDLGQDAFHMMRQIIAPTDFPGWDHMDDFGDFTNEHDGPGHVITLEPGDYAPNGFSHGPYSPGILRDGLIDLADGSAIFGFRYWGHIHGYAGDPIADRVTPEDWPEVQTAVALAPAVEPQVLTDLAPALATETALQSLAVPGNVWVQLDVGPDGPVRIVTGQDAPAQRPPRGRVERKGSTSPLGYAVAVQVINLVTEGLDLLNIIADASGYDPDHFQASVYGYNTVRSRAYWLFGPNMGIKNLDIEEALLGLIENEIEDRVLGRIGRQLRQTARDFNLGHGLQTGPAL